jgi:hypothetical protein
MISLTQKQKKYGMGDANALSWVNDLVAMKRIAEGDIKEIDNIIVTYGLIIWTLARKFTDTSDQAMIAFSEIVADIISSAGEFDELKMSLLTFIKQISHRRLMAILHTSGADVTPLNGGSKDFGVLPPIDLSSIPANNGR